MSTLKVTPAEPGAVLTAALGMGVLPQLVTQSGALTADQVGEGEVRAPHIGVGAARSSARATAGAVLFNAAAWTTVVTVVPAAPTNLHGPGDEIEALFTGNVTNVVPNVLAPTDLYRLRIFVTFTDATTLVLGPSQPTFSMTAVNQSAAENSTGFWDPIWNQRFLVTGSSVRGPAFAGKTIATVEGQVFVVSGPLTSVTLDGELTLVRRAA